jgi:hypothetical protein
MLSAPRPIADYEGVDRDRFLEDIRPAGQPAVLRGLAQGWPAVAAARDSDEALVAYMKRFAAGGPVTAIVGAPEIAGRFFYSDDMRGLNFRKGASTLAALLDGLLKNRAAPDPHAVAIQSETIPQLMPGFERENATDLVGAEVAPRAWIGNRIRVAPHYDLKENVGVVVAGRRRFTVFPPEQLPNLYPGPFELTPAGTPISLVDLAAPDLARFPRFAEAAAAALTATLEPGDAIYLPFHWWHAVDSLAPFNLFVNYWWNAAMPGLGGGYDALLHALLALRHLPDDQRAVWKMVFDHYVFPPDGADPAAHLPDHARGILGAPTPRLLARMKAMLREIAARG